MNATWQRLRATCDNLQPRDRQALTALGLFAALLLFWYGLWQPALGYHQRALQALQQERDLNAWLEAQRGAVANLPPPNEAPASRAGAGNSLTTINSSARQFQLTIKRVQPESNGDLRVWMEEANFEAALKWLHHLQQLGIAVGEIHLDQRGVGKVNLRATFTS